MSILQALSLSIAKTAARMGHEAELKGIEARLRFAAKTGGLTPEECRDMADQIECARVLREEAA